MPQYENNGNSASDAYETKQLQGDDVPLDGSWRNKQPDIRGDLAGDVQARELAENDVAREARRKIIEILGDDDEAAPPVRRQQPPTGHLRRKNPGGLTMDDLTEGMTADDLAAITGGLHDAASSAAVDIFQQGFMGEDNEAAQMAESMAGRPFQAEPTWDWVTVKAAATLRGGKRVPVWLVENKSSGMKMETPFRIQAPAERIASVLNVTGNMNDPRIRQIQEDYKQYVTLTKNGRKYKQLVESGDNDARRSLQRVRAELQGVKQRLGI